MFPRKLNPLVTFPPNFKHNALCECHDGSSRHTTENYKAFKYRVQELIDKKILSFADVSCQISLEKTWGFF